MAPSRSDVGGPMSCPFGSLLACPGLRRTRALPFLGEQLPLDNQGARIGPGIRGQGRGNVRRPTRQPDRAKQCQRPAADASLSATPADAPATTACTPCSVCPWHPTGPLFPHRSALAPLCSAPTSYRPPRCGHPRGHRAQATHHRASRPDGAAGASRTAGTGSRQRNGAVAGAYRLVDRRRELGNEAVRAALISRAPQGPAPGRRRSRWAPLRSGDDGAGLGSAQAARPGPPARPRRCWPAARSWLRCDGPWRATCQGRPAPARARGPTAWPRHRLLMRLPGAAWAALSSGTPRGAASESGSPSSTRRRSAGGPGTVRPRSPATAHPPPFRRV